MKTSSSTLAEDSPVFPSGAVFRYTTQNCLTLSISAHQFTPPSPSFLASCYDFGMKSLIFLLATFVMVTPFFVMAQADGGLVPCGTGAEYDCTTASVITLANGLITFLITMLGIIGVIAMVYAGFILVTSGGDEGAWTKGKTIFTNVVIGIIIILAAWLIVDVILKQLTGNGINYWVNF